MQNFEFHNPTRIVFGKDTHRNVGALVRELGSTVLLHYGGGSIKRSGLYDTVRASLDEHGVRVVELGGVQPNPRLSLVHTGIELCRSEGVDVILAVGGGSVIDSAKAIGAGVPYEGDVWDFYAGTARAASTLPVGVVLTIAAAGSESSLSSVITRDEDQNKRYYDDAVLYPRFAVLNPELTTTLPPYQTACGAADIMAHVMERYFTQVTHTDLTDRLCEATLRTVIDNARLALADPGDYDARAELMWAGALAHNNLLSTGREGDWASHMIEHELSGFYDVAHGAGLAVVFPAWMKHVYRENVGRFVQFAVRVWDVDFPYEDQERIALEGIRRLTAFFGEMGLPTTLGELRIGSDKIDEMAERGTARGPVGSFRKIDANGVREILRLAS